MQTAIDMLSSITLLMSFHVLGGWPFSHQPARTPPPGAPRLIAHTHERAGNPLKQRHQLETSVTSTGRGYYVGGGNVAHGDARSPHEGTWGYDDTGGHLFPRRTELRWNHGRRYQGGLGSHATDIERPIVRRKPEE